MEGIPFIMRLLAASVTSARQAGHVIRQVMSSGDLGIVEKGINDLQTEADRSAQEKIISGLKKHFPKLHIIGEEDFNEEKLMNNLPNIIAPAFDEDVLKQTCPNSLVNLTSHDVTVWVDPLDGTSEFAQGLLTHVTVLIGISHQNRAIGGVIYQPYYTNLSLTSTNQKEYQESLLKSDGRCIWALKNLGAFGFDKKLPPIDGRIICTTRSHGSKLIEDSLNACNPTEILRVGGCGHKVVLLLEGKAHGYVFPSSGCKKWDTCAPEIVLECAGGALRDMHGEVLQYDPTATTHNNRAGVLATALADWLPEYIAKIPQSVRDQLK